jgi:hydrophobe/amphiphile efflux-3 (HAE3) family protein
VTPLLRQIATPVRRAPWAVVALVVLVTVVLGAIAGTASPPESDFEDFATDTPAAQASDRIGELFAGPAQGESVQLAVVDEDGDVLSPEVLGEVQRIVGQLSADPAVQEAAMAPGPEAPLVTSYAGPVLGAAATQGIDVTQVDDDTVDRLYGAALEQLPQEQAAQLGVLLGGEVDGADATAGMLLVMFRPDASDAAIDEARAAVNAQAGTLDGGTEVYSFDFEALNEEANDTMEQQLGTLLLVAFALILLILAFVYRSVVDILASLVGLVFTIVWMQGIGTLLGPDYLGWTGGMSQMTMAVPILLVGLGVDYGIHLTMRSREEKAAGRTAEEAAAGAITAVGAALILATITTVVGFLTNLFNPLPPIKDFGVLAAVGVVAAFLVMTSFVPAVRLLVDRRRVRRGKPIAADAVDGEAPVGLLGRLTSAFAPTAVHRPGIVVAVAVAVTLAAGAGATQLSTEFSQTDFFPEGSRALETFEVIQDAFGGGIDETTNVLVEGDVDTAASLQALAGFQQGLGDVEDVRTFDGQPQADGVVTRLARAGLLEPALASDEAAAGALDQLAAADPTLSTVLTEDRDATVVRISTSAGENARDLTTQLDALGEETLAAAELDEQATSEQLVIQEILDQLRNSQISGLVITLIASMLILALVFLVRDRAPMLGVLAIASVGVTAVLVLGLMALVGIPFNVMTAMVSSLAIGIGVPFGIHVVNRFLEDRATRPDVETAMRHTLAHTGGALVGSALTTVAGFGVLVFSSIPPMQQFGLVTAITIALALLTSVTILPALLALWARRVPAPPRPTPPSDDAQAGSTAVRVG